jgi:hypothetical protein
MYLQAQKHRPKNTPLTLDKQTGHTLVLPWEKSTKMGSECCCVALVSIPLGFLVLHIFLTYLSFASFLETKTLQPNITGQLSSLLSTLLSLGY